MRGIERSAFVRYGVAVLMVFAATFVRMSIDPVVGDRFPFVSFFFATAFVAWFGGFGPAVLAMVLGSMAIPYFILEPHGIIALKSPMALNGYLAYVGVGFSIAMMGGTTRDARRRAELKAEEARLGQRRLEESLAQLAKIDAEREKLLKEQSRLLQVATAQAATITDVFEQLPVGLALIDENLKFVRVNRISADFFGRELDEIPGQASIDVLMGLRRADSLVDVEQKLRIALQIGEPFFCRASTTGSEASPLEQRFWDWSIHRIDTPNGGTIGLLFSAVEVTEHLNRERFLREIESRLRVTLGSIADAVIATDSRGAIEYMNPVAESLTGWKLAEVRSRQPGEVFEVIEEVSGKELSRDLEEVANEARAMSGAYRATLHDRSGRSRAVDFNIARIQESGEGSSGLVLVFRDMEQRRKDENALRETERRLRELADMMPQIIWTTEKTGVIDYLNARWYEYTGLDIRADSSIDCWEQVCHPEDYPQFHARRVAALDSAATLEAEARILGASGEYRWHLIRSVPILDKEGRPQRRFGTATDIHDLRMAEAATKASEDRFRQLAELMPQIVWVTTADGKMTYLNSRWAEYTGISVVEAMESRVRDEIVYPEDRSRMDRIWEETRNSGHEFEAEYRLRHHSGTYRWFLGRCVPTRDESGQITQWIGTSTDIDDTKRSEEEALFLAEAGTMLSTLVDVNSTLGSVARLSVPFFADMCAVDLVLENGELERLAMTQNEGIGLNITRASDQGVDQREPLCPMIVESLKTGEPILVSHVTEDFLERFARDETHLRELHQYNLKSMLCVPMMGRTGPIGLLTFIISESSLRYGRRELTLATELARRATIAVENARLYEELRLNDRRKNEFLAILAHELRNPLSPLLNTLYLLDPNEPNPTTRAEARDLMRRQVKHMARMVDDLMDMARINQNRIELRKELIDLGSVVERAIASSKPSIEDRGHTLEVSLPDAPITLEADSTRLGQVLDNLLSNAVKYTDPGGRISVSASARDGWAEIRVRDSGIGMLPETLDSIFEIFVQAERRTDRSQGGLGIGLSLVQRLVELHGGTVSAQSEGLGRGSEFIVRLPVAVRGVPEFPPEGSAEPLKVGSLLNPHRILVVDDNVDSARTMAMMLRRSWGQTVEVAYDGPSALRAADEFDPEVVLLDIGLPGMSGYEVARQLKANSAHADAMLIAMTGWGQNEDRRRSLESGFHTHLVKPVDPLSVLTLLQELDQKG